MIGRLADLFRHLDREPAGYSRALQAARVRASFQRPYFAPALFALIPVRSELVASMAVDPRWRLYYSDAWLTTHTVEENAAVLIHEVCHLLRDHDARRHAVAAADPTIWNTAADCEINDDLFAEDLPLPGSPPRPQALGLPAGETAETYYRRLAPKAHGPAARPRPPSGATGTDCGSGAHGERRPWDLPDDDGGPGGVGGIDSVKEELIRRDVAQRILDRRGHADDVTGGWRVWARGILSPKVDYMATIRHAVRKALRDSTIGRYDRTYRRPNRRQASYAPLIMPSFHQPRPRPGFLIDTSASMGETQLARAVAELGGLTRQLGYTTDVPVACCDAAVHNVRSVFNAAQLELYGGGGTNLGAGLRWFTDGRSGPIDLLVVVSDCHTPWPEDAPSFPVITIRVGDGTPPPWGDTGRNQVITIEE